MLAPRSFRTCDASHISRVELYDMLLRTPGKFLYDISDFQKPFGLIFPTNSVYTPTATSEPSSRMEIIFPVPESEAAEMRVVFPPVADPSFLDYGRCGLQYEQIMFRVP